MSGPLSPGGYVRQGQRNVGAPRSVNVQVAVRCRPLNDRERSQGDRNILICDPSRREVQFNNPTVARKPSAKTAVNSSAKKTFTYDQVFGPEATQAQVYDKLVQPIVDEVLEGYNCTVFAYGQTGTGKTHTMEGRRDDDMLGVEERRLALNAGIIPRAVKQVFDHLRNLTDEHSVRVSHLELYNEQLTDLLGAEEITTESLRVYEDPQKGTFVQGLEDVVVRNEEEIFAVLDRSATRRKTAETLMNKFSSRSHSIFSITIHIKESTPDGADLLKVGKLNLVDLAGSENVGRSGAVKNRAREAGNINQSLLTLGRVITALVDRHPHIPYRDSKLTRLLQESLGGRNKTCVIATVTPGSSSFEETVSTLDYAYRAKSIKNRPTVNQMIAKHVLLKEYTEEISKLKRELDATRAKNGVYLPPEEFERLQHMSTRQRDEISQLNDQTEEYERQLAVIREQLQDTECELRREQDNLAITESTLESTRMELLHTKETLSTTTQQRNENGLLVRNHVDTEKELHSHATFLQNNLTTCISDANSLHQRVLSKEALEKENISNLGNLKEKVNSGVKTIHNLLGAHTKKQQDLLELSKEDIYGIITSLEHGFESMATKIKEICDTHMNNKAESSSAVSQANDQLLQNSDACRNATETALQNEVTSLTVNVKQILNACSDISSSFGESTEAISTIRTLMDDYTEIQNQQFSEFEISQNKALEELHASVAKSIKQQNDLLLKLKEAQSNEFADEAELIKKTQSDIIEKVTNALGALAEASGKRFQKCTTDFEQCAEMVFLQSQSMQNAISETQKLQQSRMQSITESRGHQGATLKKSVQNNINSHEAGAQRSAIAVQNSAELVKEMRLAAEECKQTVQNQNAIFDEHLKTHHKKFSEQVLREQADLESTISSLQEVVLESRQETNDQAKKQADDAAAKLQNASENEVNSEVTIKEAITCDIHDCLINHSIVLDSDAANKPPIREWPTKEELPRTKNHANIVELYRRENELAAVPQEDFGHDVPAEVLDLPVESSEDQQESPAEMDIVDADDEQDSKSVRSEQPSRRNSSSDTSEVPRTDSDVSLDKLDGAVLVDTTNRRTRRSKRNLNGIRKKPTFIPLPRGRSAARKLGGS